MLRLLLISCIVPLLLDIVNVIGGSGTVHRFRVMEWNVENLFDTVHDEGFSDEEFLPQGSHHWTTSRYKHKVKEIMKVIAAVAEDNGMPDLIGLCEVENDCTLTALTRHSSLRNMDYHYVMTHSEDVRGIDVALLYQPFSFRCIEHRSIRVPSREQGLRPTRDILYVKGVIRSHKSPTGKDTLHVLVAHLPSRAGGYAGDRNRKLAAATLWGVVDSILVKPSAKVVLMGDFNADSKDLVFRNSPLILTDDPEVSGTYSFRGIWQWLDHILISASVSSSAPARPISYPWLLEEDRSYGGHKPRRTFHGPIYHGGVSDHLPLMIELDL